MPAQPGTRSEPRPVPHLHALPPSSPPTWSVPGGALQGPLHGADAAKVPATRAQPTWINLRA